MMNNAMQPIGGTAPTSSTSSTSSTSTRPIMRMSCIPTFADFLQSLVQSPLWPTVRECRNEMKAARASGQTTSAIFMRWYFCGICKIGIGPEHVEKELAFYPTLGQRMILGDAKVHTGPNDILHICGGCRRAHNVPEQNIIIHANEWEEVTLDIRLTHEEYQQEQHAGKKKTILLSSLKQAMDTRIIAVIDAYIQQNQQKVIHLSQRVAAPTPAMHTQQAKERAITQGRIPAVSMSLAAIS